jgi:hypothetical protein
MLLLGEGNVKKKFRSAGCDLRQTPPAVYASRVKQISYMDVFSTLKESRA